MTLGRVVFVSKNGAWIVAEHDYEGTVAELLGDEGLIEVGDEIRGNWGAYGEGERVFVQRLGRNVDTYFQGRYGSLSAAIQKAKEWSGDQ